jgi:hypothetical protein
MQTITKITVLVPGQKKGIKCSPFPEYIHANPQGIVCHPTNAISANPSGNHG